MPIPALALTPVPWLQFLDPNGQPYANGKLYVFEAGGEVPATVYQDSIGTPHTHPIILGTLGEATVFLPASDRAFKFVLYDQYDVLVKSADNITWEFPENAPPIPGFNADLLDGIDSSEFLRVPNADSPVVQYFDADKLDGLDGTAYALKTYVDTEIANLKSYVDTRDSDVLASVSVTYRPLIPRVTAVANVPAITPNVDTTDIVTVNGNNQGLTINNPVGTAREFHAVVIRIRDSGVAIPLAWGNAYMAGTFQSLPTATVAWKTFHMGFRYNTVYGKWQMVAYAQEP